MTLSTEVRKFLDLQLANARTELVRYNLLAAKVPELQATIAELEALLAAADADRPAAVPVGKREASAILAPPVTSREP
jgi:hypothetical protein